MYKHVIICYESGYGGDFLSGLIDKSLNLTEGPDFTDESTNRWKHESEDFYGFPIKNINYLISLRRYGNRILHGALDAAAGNKGSVKHLKTLNTVYDMIKDPDYEVFIENLKFFISNVDTSKKHVVTNSHYTFRVDKFSIWDIAKNVAPFMLTTESDGRFCMLFELLGLYKKNWQFHVSKAERITKEEVILRNTSGLRPRNVDDVPCVFVDKLFFHEEYDQAENTLSENIGTPVNLDRKLLRYYAARNNEILCDLLGSDYFDLSDSNLKNRIIDVYNRNLQAS